MTPTPEQLIQAAFENATVGITLAWIDGRFQRVNRAMCRITGRSEAELLEVNLLDITHPDDRARDQRALASLEAGGLGYDHEKRFMRPDGSEIWVEVHSSAVQDDEGRPRHVLSQVTDITERRLMQERLRYMADHDGLTGLLNRRRFEEELERHVSHGRRYGMRGALLLIDVDELKAINDSGGHRAGDSVLEAVAGVLKRRLRETDLVARHGGDEFAVLLPHALQPDAVTVGESLAAAVRAEVVSVAGPVTISVGIAMFGLGVENADDLLSAADASMYRAKAEGGDGLTSRA